MTRYTKLIYVIVYCFAIILKNSNTLKYLQMQSDQIMSWGTYNILKVIKSLEKTGKGK